MASKLTSRFVGQAHFLSFFLFASASVLLALQLQSGYAQNTREQVTLDTKTIDKDGLVPVNVKAYGAVGDGVTNDTAAFNKALEVCAAGGGVCLVPKGTYIISASGITSKVTSGVHLAGVGRGASILKIAGMPTRNLLVCNGDNWSVENLTLDLQDYYPARNLAAISCTGNKWRVANCSIIKQGRLGMSVGTGHNWSIEGNYISKTDDHNAGVQSIFTSGASTNARIINNVCEGSGMNLTGISHSIIARNRCSGAKYGSNLSTGVVGTDTLHVIGNICTGGRGRDLSNVWVSGFELWAPNSVIANNTASDNDGGGMAIGGQDCIVIGNHSFNNGGGIGSSGITARYLNSGPNNASGSIFIGNHCHDTRWPGSGMTQNYGYAEQPGGLKHIRHFGNNYNSNKIGPTQQNSIFGQRNMPEIQSSEMKNKLKALADAEDAEDIDMSDIARRALREFLDRE